MIKVLTWNILHPDYALPDRYLTNPNYLTWSHRKSLIAQELQKTNADVLCLQEVCHNDFPELKGYHVELNINKKREKEIKKGKNPLLVATYWKEDKFEKISEYKNSRTMTVTLKDKEGQEWSIMNVHLPVKVEEQVLHLQKGVNCDIVCGDFNNFPDSEVIELVQSKDYQWCQPQPRSTYYKQDIVDYIFIKPEYYNRQYWGVPSPNADGRRGVAQKMPSREWPSDHIWLCATISKVRLKRSGVVPKKNSFF